MSFKSSHKVKSLIKYNFRCKSLNSVIIRKEYNGGVAYGMINILYKAKVQKLYVYEAFVAIEWHCG